MQLTHFDENGKAIMVDVTEKNDTVREATAKGRILVSKEVYDAIEAGTVGKGDVLGVATTAGIMGAKRTSELIPMCHILPITKCRVNFEMKPEECAIDCYCTVKVIGKTGVEMEASQVSVWHFLLYTICVKPSINLWKSERFIFVIKVAEKVVRSETKRLTVRKQDRARTREVRGELNSLTNKRLLL